MRATALLFAALPLAGCGAQLAHVGGGSPAAEIFAKPLSLTGTEPFWGGEITGRMIRIERPDVPAKLFPPARPALGDRSATWTTRAADGERLTIWLQLQDCSDDMSERIYPLTGQVRIGAELLRGCAATTQAWHRAGESGRVE